MVLLLSHGAKHAEGLMLVLSNGMKMISQADVGSAVSLEGQFDNV